LLGKGEEQNIVYFPESEKNKEKYSPYSGGIRSFTIALEKILENQLIQ
jgi:hypothetical protein